MPNRSKQKGNRIERELVNQAKEYGLESQRAYASDGRSLGLSEKVDLLVGKYKIQAKGRKAFPKWLTEASEDVDGVVFKENHKKPMIMIDYEKFLELIEIETRIIKLNRDCFEDFVEDLDVEKYEDYLNKLRKMS